MRALLRLRKLTFLATLACGLVYVPGFASGDAPSVADPASQLLPVDCKLSGKIRKLGRHVTYLTPGQALKTTALDCEIRGGEYVSYDRANYETALKVLDGAGGAGRRPGAELRRRDLRTRSRRSAPTMPRQRIGTARPPSRGSARRRSTSASSSSRDAACRRMFRPPSTGTRRPPGSDR